MKREKLTPDSGDVDLIVYVFNDFDLSKVAALLKDARVKIERQLPLSGIIGIRASKSRIGELERLPGIKMVRESSRFQLPPFGEDFPQ